MEKALDCVWWVWTQMEKYRINLLYYWTVRNAFHLNRYHMVLIGVALIRARQTDDSSSTDVVRPSQTHTSVCVQSMEVFGFVYPPQLCDAALLSLRLRRRRRCDCNVLERRRRQHKILCLAESEKIRSDEIRSSSPSVPSGRVCRAVWLLSPK